MHWMFRDPMDLTAGLASRLRAAGVVLVLIWATVWWAW